MWGVGVCDEDLWDLRKDDGEIGNGLRGLHLLCETYVWHVYDLVGFSHCLLVGMGCAVGVCDG